jgi:hypothetical protein
MEMTDLGGLNLAVALVFGVAAVSLDRLLLRTVLVGYLLYAVPHLMFHSTHLAGFGTFAATVQTALQAIVALLPLGLPALTHTTRRFPGEGYIGVARKVKGWMATKVFVGYVRGGGDVDER